MINLTKFRRSGLWLLSFIAALLVLSPSASAYNTAELVGEWNGHSDWTNGITTTEKNGDNLVFKIKPKTDGTAKFQMKVDNQRYWPSSNITFNEKDSKWYESSVTSENYCSFSVSGVNANAEIKVEINPNTHYLNAYYDNSLIKTYGIRGYNNNWTSNSQNFSGSPLTLVINNYQKPTYGFKVNDGTSNYGNASATSISRNGSISLSLQNGNDGNINLASSAVGKNVTLTLELDNGVPSKLTASWDGTATIIGEWGGHTADWTGTGTSYSSSSDGCYQFDITPTSDGDLKFRFKIDGSERCPNSGSNTAMTNNSSTWQSSKAGNTGYFYIGGAKANKTYTIKYRISDGQVNTTWVNSPTPSTSEYYLAAGFLNNWGKNDRVQFTASADNPKELIANARYNESNAGNKGFKITTKATSDDGTWYSTGSTLSNNIAVTIANKTETANMKLNSKALGKDVVFTLTLDDDGKPSTLKATWVDPESSKVQIIGDLTAAGLSLNSWTDGVNTESSGTDVYTYNFTASKTGTINFGFKVDDTRYYPLWSGDCPASSDDSSANSKAFNSEKEAGEKWTYSVTKGKGYTIKVDLSQGDGVNDPVRITISETMPVYPIGVYNEAGLQRYDKWPVLYIQSKVLNNNRITPEYQMNRISDSRYELEFTLRNTKTEGDNWGEDEYPLSIVGFESASGAAQTYISNRTVKLNKTQYKEGARYKAVCEKGSNNNWTLTLTPVVNSTIDENDMPFLSMIGKEWKQRSSATTPFNNHKTTEGWQEAWVQYDSRGQQLLDRSGNVMYNTFWPPRNTIFFRTEFEVNGSKKDFTIKSDQLTFKIVDSKTGAEWKSDERFAKYAKESLDEGTPTAHVGKLALRDDRTYTLYQVKNMWINGDVKLWTGWGGVYSKDSGKSDNDAIANWSWYTNWGHYGENKYATGINPESTVQLSNRNGDVAFSKPTFFQYVDFFYEESDPNAKGHSVLFTELSEGGAQIAAMSTKKESTSNNDYEIGNYQPSLNYLQGLDEGELKKVTIRSYATTSDGDNAVEEMISNIFSWTATEGSPVKNKDFYTLFLNKPSNVELPGEGGYTNSDDENKSEGKWVKDTYNYNNGDYFYRMTVVLTDNNGKTHNVTVDSNPFTIFNEEETITLSVYQLVKVDEEINNGVRTGRYYTFKGSEEDHSVPVLPVYEVWIKNDDKYDTNNNAYDEDGNLVGYIDDTHYEFAYRALDELPDYGMSNEAVEEDENITRMQFTDKVLIVGSVPSANVIEGYAYGVADKDQTPSSAPARVAASGPQKAAITEEFDQSCQHPENGDRFMHVTNIGSFEEREFTLQMKYSTSFLDYEGNLVSIDGATTVPVSSSYTATVPEPMLKEVKVQVFYGDTDKEETDNDLDLFDYRGKSFQARYHSVRDYIEVEFPNVSHFLKERLIKKNFFTLKLTQTVEGEVREWDNIFTFTSDGTADGVVVGPVMHPSVFNQSRTMTLVSDPNYNYYTRWEDGDITPIYVTDNAPINFNHEVKDASLYYDENGDLISKFTIVVKHKDDYTPSDPADVLDDAKKDKHNYVFHTDKDLFEHLHHHSERDFYYVAIIDKDMVNSETVGDEDAIIDQYGNVTEDNNERLHDVVRATDLLVTAGGKGKEFTITKNYGHYYDGQLEAVKNDHYSKHLKVLVSYLYPFANTQTSPAPKRGIKRAIVAYSNNVLKSKAAPFEFTSEVVTSVTDIYGNDLGKVYSGVGFIEVEGNGVEIYGADGVKIATGEGRHEVNAGVYVVRVNGRTQKVIVR